MVEVPWRTRPDGEGRNRPSDEADDAPIVECAFQDGTLLVYEDRVVIERAAPSKFEDKTIPRDEITDVRYAGGLVIGHLQIEQAGVTNDAGGFLTSPVDENTLHFGRGARDCAEEVREELLFGTG